MDFTQKIIPPCVVPTASGFAMPALAFLAALFAIACPVHAGTPPANDNFANRTVLSGPSAVISSYNTYATTETGEPTLGQPAIGRSLWWSWTAPYTGWANFSTYGSGQSLLLAIYTGDTLETLSSVAFTNPLSYVYGPLQPDGVSLPVSAGKTYQIAIAVPETSAASSATLADRVILGVNQPPTIVSDASASGVKGTGFGYQIVATNNPTQYSAQGLPPGLVLNSWTGNIAGTPTTAGVYDAYISATGPGGTTTASLRLEIAPQAAPLQPPDFSAGSVAVVVGYVGANLTKYFYVSPSMSAFSADSLPPGLTATMAPSGSYATISGIPTQSGTFKVTLGASNTTGSCKAFTTFQILAHPPAPIITSRAVAYGTIGTPFSYAFSSGYIPNDSRTITYATGNLPPGLTFSGTSISGAPTAPGTYTVPVQATNDGGTTNATLTIVVGSPAEAPAPVTAPPVFSNVSAAVGVASRTFSYSASAGNAPATYSATGLPAGLSINPATGQISGTSPQSGTFLAMVSATNASGTTTTPLTLTLRAPKPPLLTSAAAAAGTVGVSFSYALTASDSEYSSLYDSPPTPTIQLQAGPLPAGLSFTPSSSLSSFQTASGSITGKPTTAGTYRIPVSATAHGVTTQAILTLIIADRLMLPPVITSGAAAHGNVGTAFFYTLYASNSPTAFSVSSLPAGLTFDSSTGSISGTPTQAGTFTIDASATNALGTGTAKLTFIIDPTSAPSPSTGESAATEGFVGTSFSDSLDFSDPISESVTFTASGLPPGLTIPASSTGNYVSISGTPTQAGTFPVTIAVQGANGITSIVKTFVIRAAVDPPTITSSLSTEASVGASFYYYIYANGGGSLTYTAASLPPGLSLSGNQISGTPTAAGIYEIPLSVSNAGGTSNATLVLRVAALPPAPVPSVAASTRAYLNSAFSFYFYASGNVSSWAVSGSLPAGVSFNPSGPSFIGTPTQTGTFPLRITATGPGGSVTVPFTLVVDAILPPPVITSPIVVPLRSITTSYPLSASNAPISYSATGLPAGLTFNSSTGSFYGYVPYAAGKTYPVTVSATNSSGTASATVTFLNSSYSLSGTSLETSFGASMALGALNTPFTYRFAPLSYPSSRSVSATGLPAGLTLNFSTGIITGIPTQSGTFAVKISATGYNYYPIDATLTLVIQDLPPAPLITSPGLLSGAVGAAFSATLSAAKASSFSFDSLPPGLSLDPVTGTISGKPTTAGRFTVKASATNIGGTTISDLIFDLAAAPAIPTFSSAAAARGYQGISFSYSVSASNQPTRYEADGLPPGLSINVATGSISGKPTTPGRYIATLRAINAGGTGTAKLAIDITTPSTPVISSYSYVEGMVGKSVSFTISASDSPTSFFASDLPPGLVLDASTGSISGTPTIPGTYLVPIGATNAGGTGSARMIFHIVSGKPSWLISTAAASGLVGIPFRLPLSDSDHGSLFDAADLPPGLSLTGSLLSGTPTTAGTYLVPIRVHDGDLVTNATITLRIDAAPSMPPLVTSSLTAGIVLGGSNTYPITASNAPTAIDATSLPAGFRFDTSTWSVSCTPDSAGSYPFEISATNALGITTAQVTFLTVSPNPQVLSTTATAFGTVGGSVLYPLSLVKDTTSDSIYSSNWNTSDLTATPTVNIRNLPPGLYFDRTNLQIRGTATLAGDYPVELLSSDIFGNLTSSTVLFHIAGKTIPPSAPTPLQISSAPLSIAGAMGSPLSFDVWPTGGATGIAMKNLPPGLTLAATSGSSNGIPTKFARITGQPTAPGTYPVELTFSNDTETATAVVTVLVPALPLPPALDSYLLVRGTVGRSFLSSFWENESYYFHNATVTYQVDDLPRGLSFDVTHHWIQGTPTQAGRFLVPIALTNAGGTTPATLTIVIDGPNTGRPRLTGSGGVGFASSNVSAGFTAATTGYVGEGFTFTLRSDNAIDHLSVSGLPASLTLVDSGSGTWEIRGTPTEAGTINLLLTATNAQGTTTVPLTLSLRTLNQSTHPPLPDVTPTPVTSEHDVPVIALNQPRKGITTAATAVTIRGRVLNLQPGTLIKVRRLPGGHWKKVRINGNGLFKFRLSDLPEGVTKATIRVTSAAGKTTTRTIRIHRQHS